MDQKTAAHNDQLLRISMGDPVWLIHTGKTMENKNGKLVESGDVEADHVLTLGWMGTQYELPKGKRVKVPRRCAVHHMAVCQNVNTPKIKLLLEEIEASESVQSVKSAAEERAELKARLAELEKQEEAELLEQMRKDEEKAKEAKAKAEAK